MHACPSLRKGTCLTSRRVSPSDHNNESYECRVWALPILLKLAQVDTLAAPLSRALAETSRGATFFKHAYCCDSMCRDWEFFSDENIRANTLSETSLHVVDRFIGHTGKVQIKKSSFYEVVVNVVHTAMLTPVSRTTIRWKSK